MYHQFWLKFVRLVLPSGRDFRVTMSGEVGILFLNLLFAVFRVKCCSFNKVPIFYDGIILADGFLSVLRT